MQKKEASVGLGDIRDKEAEEEVTDALPVGAERAAWSEVGY